MRFSIKHLSLVAISVLLIGCGGGGGTSSTTTGSTSAGGTSGGTTSGNTSSTKNITITEDYQVESLGLANTINATVNLGNTPKSLYILLSNYHETQSASSSITHNKMVAVQESKEILTTPSTKQIKALHTHASIQEFNKNSKNFFKKNTFQSENLQAKSLAISTVSKKDVEGNSQPFYLKVDTSLQTQATARKVVSNISTPLGFKTLNIWVSDDSFGIGCERVKCVTQLMVDALADTFLKAGADNDIYDWVTNIYGEEWGADAQAKFPKLIPSDDEITILLTDIDDDNSTNGGTIGFFHSKDNFDDPNIPGSNKRIMFYADAVLFAQNDSAIWSIDDFWPKEMVSTLAHEFQHMIHYYQKQVLLDTQTETWINEMLAETTEDLVATKIGHTGPRGVDPLDGSAGNDTENKRGRYPLFNQNNTLSLTEWTGQLRDYSKVNAFGAFLVRNYGGAKVLRDVMHNAFSDENAVVSAVAQSVNSTGKTFDDLLKEWGIAVLLSDNENLQNQPTYNTGDFTQDTYNGSTYELGSINFFNYSPAPTIYTLAGTVAAQGNYYYKVGDNLTGTVTIDLTLNGTTEATLIAK